MSFDPFKSFFWISWGPAFIQATLHRGQKKNISLSHIKHTLRTLVSSVATVHESTQKALNVLFSSETFLTIEKFKSRIGSCRTSAVVTHHDAYFERQKCITFNFNVTRSLNLRLLWKTNYNMFKIILQIHRESQRRSKRVAHPKICCCSCTSTKQWILISSMSSDNDVSLMAS